MKTFYKCVHGIFYILISTLFCSLLYAHSDTPPLSCLGSGIDKFNVIFAAPSVFTCGSLGCHYQYPVNSGKGKFKLYVKDKCEPEEMVDILVTFEKTDTDIHGFQIAAQDSYYGNRLVGVFINAGDDDDTQIEANGHFASHTKKGTNQKFWHVKWQAPQKDFFIANPVRFYAMGIESDNDGSPMGDYIYKATRLITVETKKSKTQQVRKIMKE